MKYVKEFRYGDELIALLVTKEFRNRRPTDHATFVSADNQSLQLGVGHYPKGLSPPSHTHEKVQLNAHYEELIHLIKGRMRVDLYGNDSVNFASFMMKGGDTVHLISGGHGFEMLSPCKCIEVKQGPYQGWNNKKVFEQTERGLGHK